MIYITQLIYIKPGMEAVFHQFEEVAIPLIAKYRGQLLIRLRPEQQAFVESTVENPYEIHLVSFPGDDDLAAFMKDEERKKFLHLKEDSIRETILIKGTKL